VPFLYFISIERAALSDKIKSQKKNEMINKERKREMKIIKKKKREVKSKRTKPRKE
jgi:hypothetical protein